MDSMHREDRRDDGLGTAAELLSGSYDLRRALGKGRSYLRYEADTEGQRATLMLLPIDCEDRPDLERRVGDRLAELRTLDHPGTAPVLRHGVRSGVPYVEHPAVAGRTLTEQLEQGPVGRDRALSIAAELLEAVAYAHGRGFCHGALTPDDVVLVRDSYGEERVMIFGIGLPAVVRDLGAASPKLPESDRYAAPEVLEGAPPSGRADVYSIGALLYRMITDEVPPPAPIVSPFAGNPLLPRDLEPLFIRALACDLFERYPSAAEMLLEVDHAVNANRALSSRPPRPKRHSQPPVASSRERRAPWLAGAALLAAGAGLAIFAFAGQAAPVSPGALTSAPPLVATAPSVGVEAPEETTPVATPAVAAPEDLGDSTSVEEPVVVFDEGAAPAALAGDDALAEDVAIDPLAHALPEELEGAAERLLDGEELTRAELAPIYRYSAANPDDARASLILGDAFVELGWYSDAIDRYLSAHTADPASRQHTVMLENLVWLTFKDRHVADFAADAIAEIYGAAAVPAVAAAIASRPEGPGQLERLERLYTRIAR